MAPTAAPADEALFYLLNLQPVVNSCPGDLAGPPDLKSDLELSRWAALRLFYGKPVYGCSTVLLALRLFLYARLFYGCSYMHHLSGNNRRDSHFMGS